VKDGQQTPINIPGLNGYFVCLEEVKTKKTSLLTWNSSACEITLLAYVILKHVIEEKIEGNMEVKGRRGIRCKQLLDDLKEKRRYFKEEALNRTVWRTRFIRSYGPVIRKIRKMNFLHLYWLRNFAVFRNYINYIFLFMISNFYTFVTVSHSIWPSGGTILDQCKIDLP
jgi:hypothetical protein